MWKLTIEDDQANKTVVHLVRDEYTIGRAEDNAIRPPSGTSLGTTPRS
jgi:hypothetical protein